MSLYWLSIATLIGAACGEFILRELIRISPSWQPNRVVLIVASILYHSVCALLVRARFSSVELRLAFSIMCIGLFLQTVIDIFTHMLLRAVTNFLFIVGVVLFAIRSLRTQEFDQLIVGLLCAIVGWGLFLLIHHWKNDSIGIGDLRLVPALGLYLGFLGAYQAVLGLFVACFGAGLFGAALLIAGRGKLRTKIAFGPFLSIGALSATFFGEQLLPTF